MSNSMQLMQPALAAFRAGRLDEAERECRGILADQPAHAPALNILGIIANARGQKAQAREFIQQAAESEPAAAEYPKNLASLCHDAGEFTEAERWSRRAIENVPGYAEGHYLLGTSLLGQGRLEEARLSLERAIALKSDFREAYNNLGGVLRAQRRFEEAITCCKRIIELDGSSSQAHSNLGSLLRDVGRNDEAVASYERALQLQPQNVEAMDNLGTLLQTLGRLHEAVAMFRRALEIQPAHAGIRGHLASALQAQGKPEEAGKQLRQIVAAKPTAENLNQLGVVLQSEGKKQEAMECYRKAIDLEPRHAGALSNMGYAHAEINQPAEAIKWYHKALEIRPDLAEAHNNLGNAHRALHEVDQALKSYEKTILFKPDSVDGHWNKSLALLLKGDMAGGWQEYEWRWLRFPEFKRSMPKPLWDGSELKGRTILLHAEQGFGDTLQFIRFAPQVKARGGRVILEAEPETYRVLKTAPGIEQVFSRGQPVGDFDFHIPLMTLPLVLEVTLANLPECVPYLSAELELREKWKARLGDLTGKKKVGIVWAGRPIHKNDHNRSIKWEMLQKLLDVPETIFVSLQKGPAAKNCKEAAAEGTVIDLSDEIQDFADTAAVIANLDLVIAVDTAVVHLAGAMGKPVWTMLPFDPDWRWLLGRNDSPWYPTVRLFRQPAIEDWATVIETVATTLNDWPSPTL